MIIVINRNASDGMKRMLKKKGHYVVESMSYPGFVDATATHPDMQIHPLRNNLAITAPSCYTFYRKRLPNSIVLIKGGKEITGTYPDDCAYNVARVGNTVFCNTNYACAELLQYYRKEKKNIVHVNQGYAKCNMAIIGNRCVITEDIGIHNTIIENQLPIKSIFIPKGEVLLQGFPYGFIGGACGGDKNQLFWYGDSSFCSYNSLIEEEIAKQKIKSIALEKKKPLVDFGGIICLAK